jgi:hypothetical protein
MAHVVATIGTTHWAAQVAVGRHGLTLRGGAEIATTLAETAA